MKLSFIWNCKKYLEVKFAKDKSKSEQKEEIKEAPVTLELAVIVTP